MFSTLRVLGRATHAHVCGVMSKLSMKPTVRNKRFLDLSLPSGQELCWESDKDIRDARYYDAEDVLLVIQEENKVQWLVGLNVNGVEIFKVAPPENWYLYYLSTHVNFNIAVVCVSEQERFDWFFGVNAKNGDWSSLNRAY
jgi:hypothetical protein